MSWLKRIIKSVFVLCVLCIVAFAALDFYFTHVNRIDRKVRMSANQRIHTYHVHVLTYDQIPEIFKQAVIATEDRRFATDPGIDPIGILRSLVIDIEHDGYIEGGSTITQQVIDNTILHRRKTLKYKFLQAAYAIGLYDTITKEETFEMYTNIIYFGHGAYGLYNAAETYFNRTPSNLNAGELTLLAGLPNSPSNYDPFVSMSLARKRQQIVLENMVDDGVISTLQSQEIFQQPIRLAQK